MIRFEANPEVDPGELDALFSAAWPAHRAGALTSVLPRSLAFVCAFDGDRLIGFANLAWDGGVHAFLLDPTIHPDFQRRGIGTRLVQRAIAVARERGVEWLHVDYEDRLSGFYHRCGFRSTSAGLIRLPDTEVRSAARLVVMDSAGRVLLFRHRDPRGREFWATPGGGLEPGETPEQAARREAAEELGVRDVKLVLLWTGYTEFPFSDHWTAQTESFFLVKEQPALRRPEVRETHRREGIEEVRWWKVEDIEASREAIYPADLADRIREATPLPGREPRSDGDPRAGC